jgi:ribA/ribD-fused uncharacterized protein
MNPTLTTASLKLLLDLAQEHLAEVTTNTQRDYTTRYRHDVEKAVAELRDALPTENGGADMVPTTGENRLTLDTPEAVYFYEQDFYPLSNFSAFNVTLMCHEGVLDTVKGIPRRFETSEQAYHYFKFPGVANITRMNIMRARSAHDAFKIAQTNRAKRRPDWDEIKDDIMRQILRAKVQQHEYVARKLLATGDRMLIENSWRDDYWGWGPRRDGMNRLGILWMEIRAQLRDQVKP